MFINNFDPVALEIFSLEIRWYSLAYIFGIISGWILAKKLFIKNMEIKNKEDIELSANHIIELGAKAVLIKGGGLRDMQGKDFYFDDTGKRKWLGQQVGPCGSCPSVRNCLAKKLLAAWRLALC